MDRSSDRRVRKTRGLLHGALAALIHEKPFDAIVVKEILARADVGRSTFYAHFRDKEELLDVGLRDMLRACAAAAPAPPATGATDRILRFSLPLFTHVARVRGHGDASAGARGQRVVHERLERVLADSIADELRRSSERPRERGRDVPADLLARHVASTFVLVLSWWMERGERLPPERAHELFRALVVPALTEAVGS